MSDLKVPTSNYCCCLYSPPFVNTHWQKSINQHDHDKLCKLLATRLDSIHKYPDNEYQNFINAFVFVNRNLRRQEVVSEGKKFWQYERSDCMQQGTLPSSKIDLIFHQAVDKIKVPTPQEKLNALSKPIPKVGIIICDVFYR